MTSLPHGLHALVASYENRTQLPVRFRPSSWDNVLAASQTGITSLLRDDRYTEAYDGRSPSLPGDRTTTRAAVVAACSAMNLDDTSQVLRAFVLTMAWGSGTTGSRGLRNTAAALTDVQRAHAMLSDSARILRRSTAISGGDLRKAHAGFVLPGVRQAFFTKWFTFAGDVRGRPWQPLILDSRVYTTLNCTLDVGTVSLAGSRIRAARYQAYVDTIYKWAHALAAEGLAVDGQRLEWILFAHNGQPLSAA
jgi:hypothetical protein